MNWTTAILFSLVLKIEQDSVVEFALVRLQLSSIFGVCSMNSMNTHGPKKD